MKTPLLVAVFCVLGILVVVGVFGLLVIGCGSGGEPPAPEPPAQEPAPKEAPEEPAAEAPEVSVEELAADIDPVCGMSLREHAIAATAVYENKQYGFCSAYCKSAFEKDPAKHLEKLALRQGVAAP